MYAGPRLGLGLGSHADQSTRDGPQSVLFQINDDNRRLANTWGAIRLRELIN